MPQNFSDQIQVNYIAKFIQKVPFKMAAKGLGIYVIATFRAYSKVSKVKKLRNVFHPK